MEEDIQEDELTQEQILYYIGISFIESLDLETCIEDPEFFYNLSPLKPSKFYTQLIEKITNYEKCQIEDCSTRARTLKCKHKYCKDHISDTCPSCSQEIEYSDKEYISKLFCQSCYREYPVDVFSRNTCMHQCKNCIQSSILKYQKCEVCFKRYEDSLVKTQNECIRCEKAFNSIALFYIGCNHLLCSFCLDETVNSKFCIQCSRIFQDNDRFSAERFFKNLWCSECSQNRLDGDFEICNNSDCQKFICSSCFELNHNEGKHPIIN